MNSRHAARVVQLQNDGPTLRHLDEGRPQRVLSFVVDQDVVGAVFVFERIGHVSLLPHCAAHIARPLGRRSRPESAARGALAWRAVPDCRRTMPFRALTVQSQRRSIDGAPGMDQGGMLMIGGQGCSDRFAPGTAAPGGGIANGRRPHCSKGDRADRRSRCHRYHRRGSRCPGVATRRPVHIVVGRCRADSDTGCGHRYGRWRSASDVASDFADLRRSVFRESRQIRHCEPFGFDDSGHQRDGDGKCGEGNPWESAPRWQPS